MSNADVTPADDTVSSDCEDDVVEQVANGELDGALVFRAEVTVPEGAEVIEVPEDTNLVIDVSYVVGDGGECFRRVHPIRRRPADPHGERVAALTDS